MVIKKGDFIEVEYTGRIRVSSQIFDSTDEATAKKAGIKDDNAVYGPKVICVSRNYILDAIDETFVGKEKGASFTLELKPEQSFGHRDSKLIKTFPIDTLRKQKINPFPGLQLDLGGMVGVVRSVNSGRVMMDFNSPLAGRDVMYKIKIKDMVTDELKQLEGLVVVLLTLSSKDFTIEKKEEEYVLTVKKKVPDEIKKEFSQEVFEVLPKIKFKFA